ncbi:hypothetical protein Q3C01_21350 [Bradyrhizobium sp. UFLA05-109]
MTAYGTPRELFIKFFRVIRDVLRELPGDERSPDTDEARKKPLCAVAGLASIPT